MYKIGILMCFRNDLYIVLCGVIFKYQQLRHCCLFIFHGLKLTYFLDGMDFNIPMKNLSALFLITLTIIFRLLLKLELNLTKFTEIH